MVSFLRTLYLYMVAIQRQILHHKVEVQISYWILLCSGKGIHWLYWCRLRLRV